MTEYEKIRNELVDLGWEETQGRGDHRKFIKEGMRPISISMSISDSSRAFRNACANIRRVEPGFSLGKAVMGKDKEKRMQVQERVLNRLSEMTDEQKRLRAARGFIVPGARVRYVAPEGRDWNRLGDGDALMNVPYIVVGVSGAGYVSKNDDSVTIEPENDGGGRITVGQGDVESWDLKECLCCHRRYPASAGLADCDPDPLKEVFEDLDGGETNPMHEAVRRSVEGISGAADLCPDCIVELGGAVATCTQDMEKKRVDFSKEHYEEAVPAELRGKFHVTPAGDLVLEDGLALTERMRLHFNYAMYRMMRQKMAADMARDALRKVTKVAKASVKPTLYNSWDAFRGQMVSLFPDVPGLAALTYHLNKIRSVFLFELSLSDTRQVMAVTSLLDELYDMLGSVGQEHTYVRVRLKDECDNIMLPHDSAREDECIEDLRASLRPDDFERLLSMTFAARKLPHEDVFRDALVATCREMAEDVTAGGGDRLFPKIPLYTFFSTFRSGDDRYPVIMLLLHCDNGAQSRWLHENGKAFGERMLSHVEEAASCEISFELSVHERDFSTLDPADAVDYGRLLNAGSQIWNGVAFRKKEWDDGEQADRIRRMLEDVCDENMMDFIRARIDRRENWKEFLKGAAEMFTAVLGRVEGLAREMDISENDVLDTHYIVQRREDPYMHVWMVPADVMSDILEDEDAGRRAAGGDTMVNTDNTINTDNIYNTAMEETKTGTLQDATTRELLAELKRRGVRNLDRLEIPVVTYQNVNVDEL